MISRDTILEQMEGLALQARKHEEDLRAIHGAVQLCRHWLAECDRQDAVAREKGQTQLQEAERNGELADEASAVRS